MNRVFGWLLCAALAVLAGAPRSDAAEGCAAAGGSAGACGGCAKGCDCRDHHCDVCGRHAHCQKICHLVVGTKKVTKTCYDSECEDFCLPGPSKFCGVCKVEEKDPCTGCVRRILREKWIPGECAQVRTKHTLVKREITKEVPAYKWEVQKVCGACSRRCLAENHSVPQEMIANEKPALDAADDAEETREVVQASANEPANERQPAATPTPATTFKQKLMSLLGK